MYSPPPEREKKLISELKKTDEDPEGATVLNLAASFVENFNFLPTYKNLVKKYNQG